MDTTSCRQLPVPRERDRHADVVLSARLVGPVALVPVDPLSGVPVGPSELLPVAEPVQVVLEMLRRDTVEAVHEMPEPRVHRVHHVDVVRRPVLGVDRDVRGPECGKCPRVLPLAVRLDRRAQPRPAAQDPQQVGLAGLAAAAHLGELVAELVDAGDGAHPQVGEAAHVDVAAAAMPLARHLERAGALVAGGARVVAAQALREVLPVDLDLADGAERLEPGGHDLARPVAHEPGRPQARPAPLGALAQGEGVGQALGEVHPLGRRQLGLREQPARARRERAGAAPAEVPLTSPGVAAAPDELGAPAVRACVRLAPRRGQLLGDHLPQVGRERDLLAVAQLPRELPYHVEHGSSSTLSVRSTATIGEGPAFCGSNSG